MDSDSASRLASSGGQDNATKDGGKGSAFWLTFFALAVCTLLSAIDLTAVGLILPTLTKDLNGGDEFAWVGSAYALSSTAVLPLTGSLADAFGRRPIMVAAILFFALGSALAGAAQNMNMMIAGRAIQGIGGGGILNLGEIIMSDLVPLAERGIAQGVFGLTWAFAAAIGPPIGGAFAQRASWRWLFYLNLPLCGISLFLVLFFLRVRTPPGDIRAKLARIDWIGNFIIIAGATLAITGLTFGGIRFPWDSAQVLAPLIIGLVLMAFFFFYEAKFAEYPCIPWDVVGNLSGLSGYLTTFFHGIVSIALIYYISVYFQACLGAAPIRAGVDTLPAALFIAFFALGAGGTVQAINKYTPPNIAGWVFIVVGFGVMSLLKADSSVAQWVGYQVLATAGIGVLYTAPIFTVLAPLSVERNASALAFFSFVRNFAYTWGVTIAATVLQNELKKKLPDAFLALFSDSVEIAYAAIPVIRTLDEPLRTEVKNAFADSMSVVWKVMIGIGGLGFLSLALIREIPMQQMTDDRFGLHEGEKVSDEEKAAAEVAVIPEMTN
ncbi:hypothetical protein EIP86_003077 [Pleurotus ostreatoroseus]|nr:hypothetical protein EIP86_003077 [Pleurotus ostreatoroseus]